MQEALFATATCILPPAFISSTIYTRTYKCDRLQEKTLEGNVPPGDVTHTCTCVHVLHTDQRIYIPYITYYKPMGDLPYISSEQGGGLIIHQGLIMQITIYKHPIPIQEL